MYTNDYDFVGINAVKILLVNDEGKILLTQEPENFTWMPLHWGLPGGKATNKESLFETFERKCASDIGQKLKIEGIYRIMELIQEKRTIFMYIVVAKTNSSMVSGDAKEYKWVGKEDVENMMVSDFTEFYNKEMLIEFLSGKQNIVSPDIVSTLPYYSMAKNSEYTAWLKSGKRNE